MKISITFDLIIQYVLNFLRRFCMLVFIVSAGYITTKAQITLQIRLKVAILFSFIIFLINFKIFSMISSVYFIFYLN
jgi:hypothetical protein